MTYLPVFDDEVEVCGSGDVAGSRHGAFLTVALQDGLFARRRGTNNRLRVDDPFLEHLDLGDQAPLLDHRAHQYLDVSHFGCVDVDLPADFTESNAHGRRLWPVPV